MPASLFFLHIAKTAGTTLNELLDNRFHTDHILPHGYFTKKESFLTPDDVEIHRNDLARFRLIRDHFANDVRRQYFPDHTAMVVLREPKARIVSYYNDWHTKSDENLATAGPQAKNLIRFARAHSLKDVLRSELPLVRRLYYNAQARQVAASLDDTDHTTAGDRAAAALAEFQIVGLTERLSQTAQLLFQHMGWGAPPELPRRNTSRGSVQLESLDDETHELLEQATFADQILYVAAKQRLERDLKALNAPESQTQPVPSFNPPILAPGQPFEYDMRQPLLGTGWHVREGLDIDQAWRWTGPTTTSTLALPLNPATHYDITIRAISELKKDLLNNAQLTINGSPLQTKVKRAKGGREIRARIDRSLINTTGPTKLTIELPRVMRHTDIKPDSHDTRPKGIAIDRITCTPAATSTIEATPHATTQTNPSLEHANSR